MKLDFFAICRNYTILFVICLLSILVKCNDLAEMRVLIENIDFSSVDSNRPVPSSLENSIRKNDFKSQLLYDKLAVHQSEFKFKQFYENFTIFFGDASTSWILAQKTTTSSINLVDVYVSRDHGANYELFSFLSNSFLLNNLFINYLHPKIVRI